MIQGNEWSPQAWLPQPALSAEEIRNERRTAVRSIFQAVARFPELAQEGIVGFGAQWDTLENFQESKYYKISELFHVINGKSIGEKSYMEGNIPYVSSGDLSNSIISLKHAPVDEVFDTGGITVTAFGTACIQPWPFIARGNGGSSVSVLLPRFEMNFEELAWFAAMINAQRWRFFYARMAIKRRLSRLTVGTPRRRFAENETCISGRLRRFQETLDDFSDVAN